MGTAGQVSPLTLNRLSIYLRCLRYLRDNGVEKISSHELADRFQLSATQIRKDLAQFGEFGIRGVGYDVDQLTERLNHVLGLDLTHRIIVVGVGNLGSALMRFLNFDNSSFSVVAAVDNDPEKVGQLIADIPIQSSSRLRNIVETSKAEIGVLTVPGSAAQQNYDELVSAGIKAVLNFAPIRLVRKSEVVTKAVDLRIFFEEVGFFLRDEPGRLIDHSS
jgi:redox-sensing transcriptional repressor